MLRDDVDWPENRLYLSGEDYSPLCFFSECLCQAKTFDLMLGFFSSTAISVLASGFAVFLGSGGKMRLLINTALSETDQEALKGTNSNFFSEQPFDLSDIENLAKTLSRRDRHFFECLSYLIANDRIEIKAMVPANSQGIAHTKWGSFSDGENWVAFHGSCNFSATALLLNYENIEVDCSWDGEISERKIGGVKAKFEATFAGKNNNVKLIDIEDISQIILDTFPAPSLIDLQKEGKEFLEEDLQRLPDKLQRPLRKAGEFLEFLINNPKFPYSSGPRDYQIEAFENWRKNGQRGFFAMATGTGKTITALNILLEIFKRSGSYKALILVPSKSLAEQWEKECRSFNFHNIVQISDNPHWRNEVASIQRLESFGLKGLDASFVIICTYASFGDESKFAELTNFQIGTKKSLLFIADEAHSLGSSQLVTKLGRIPFPRRVGLSATPERQFQQDVTNQILQFFGARDELTYEYSMQKAIENGVLCRYCYYPKIVSLEPDEMEQYTEITEQIRKMWGVSTALSLSGGQSSGNTALEMLLLKRKRIIHKARNKLKVFRELIQKLYDEKAGDLKYCLVYAPEGDNEGDIDLQKEPLIDSFTRAVRNLSPKMIVNQFTAHTANREVILRQFAKGKINVLTSMKCLDEGVDVPRAEVAIFCASTGNPRQYIQRRGRILRTHPEKNLAYIYDLLVVPETCGEETFEVEKALMANELRRVYKFASLAENKISVLSLLEPILKRYKLNPDLNHE
jgi:superfamily II DNA or RNA helicase